MAICGPWTRTGLSQMEAAEVSALYHAADPPPDSVTTTQHDDGTYTVVGVWPACAPGQQSDEP